MKAVRIICRVCQRPLLLWLKAQGRGHQRPSARQKIHPDCLWRWVSRRQGDRKRLRTIEGRFP